MGMPSSTLLELEAWKFPEVFVMLSILAFALLSILGASWHTGPCPGTLVHPLQARMNLQRQLQLAGGWGPSSAMLLFHHVTCHLL